MSQISLNLTDLQTERTELGEFLARPDAYNDPEFTRKNKRFSELETLIEKARERLRTGAAIAHLAHDLGFADQSHFHRMFVKFYSVTPGCYQRGRSHSYNTRK